MTTTEAEIAAIRSMESEFEASMTGSFGDDQTGKRFWHFTNSSGLCGIVENKKIWATHCRFTNDSSELDIGFDAVQEAAHSAHANLQKDTPAWQICKRFALEHRFHSLPEIAPVYLASFSQPPDDRGDDLVYWRSYGAHGHGYALVFQDLPAPEVDTPGAELAAMLVSCIYDRDDFMELARLQFSSFCEIGAKYFGTLGEAAIDQAGVWLMRQAGALLPRLKHSAFKSEQEWHYVAVPTGKIPQGHPGRLAKFRTTDHGLAPYVELSLGMKLPLVKVVVGPSRDQDHRAEGVRLLLAKNDLDPNMVVTSKIPFRG